VGVAIIRRQQWVDWERLLAASDMLDWPRLSSLELRVCLASWWCLIVRTGVVEIDTGIAQLWKRSATAVSLIMGATLVYAPPPPQQRHCRMQVPHLLGLELETLSEAQLDATEEVR
jgi:hypothetical protein